MKQKLTFTLLYLLLGFCFFTAYPSTTIELTSDVVFEICDTNSEQSSVKSVSNLHANGYSERVITHYHNTFSPQYLKKHSDDDIKSVISKHQTLIKRSKYQQYSRNLILNFLSTDIIFPHHTFW